MNDTPRAVEGEATETASLGLVDGMLRAQVLARFGAIRTGNLRIVDRGEEHAFGPGAAAASDDLRARVHVLDPQFWSAIGLKGSVGAGEAYMDGWWRADDLVDVVRLLVRNRDALEELEEGLARLAVPILRFAHDRRRNHREGSRRNIAEHYDLGNEFYALWLDESLTYSAAIFESPGATLAEAQFAKLDRICRKLDLSPDDHVIEIGTGWGSFAVHAAQRYGCRVTTTTISAEQRRIAEQRIAAAGLADRVTVLDQDYRDLVGTYDKLVSIEMIEAVGHEFLDTYFAKCAQLLRPEGSACIQAITIADRFHDRALHSVDFIQRYIFPGCYIPSEVSIAASIARATDFRLVATERIGSHYAQTLRVWRERFLDRLEQVHAQGFDERFVRMWEFYLAYCEGGFAEGQLDDVQLLFARPDARA